MGTALLCPFPRENRAGRVDPERRSIAGERRYLCARPKGDGKRQDPRRSAPDHRSKEWAALVRHRKRMSEKSREFLLAKLDRLIRETEKKIADLTKR